MKRAGWFSASLFVAVSLLACGGDVKKTPAANSDPTAPASTGARETCSAPKATCHGVCTDVTKNQDHCGACDRACESMERCEDGQCVFYGCNPELEICDGICRSLSHAETCGSCGTSCGAGQVCSLSQCKDACAPKLTACDGACVDLTRDPANCGACGATCTGGCVKGKCSTPCPAPLQTCVGGCRALDRDPLNCGLCGHACEPGASCASGVCQKL